jgi:predicted AAA+ superfamily ATPase
MERNGWPSHRPLVRSKYRFHYELNPFTTPGATVPRAGRAHARRTGPPVEPGRDDMLRGALYETYVVAQNLAVLLEAHVPEAQMGYWHEQGRHEVDFVIEVGRKVFAIEVKAATRCSQNDLSGLRAFLERTPACVAAVLAYNGKEAVNLGDRLWVIPLGMLLA